MPKGMYQRADPALALPTRFWSKVNKSGPVPIARPDLGPCWIWTAGLNGDPEGSGGYGELRVGSSTDGTRRVALAHRVAYELLVGTIPPELTIDHLCRNRACVNPDHMEPVTNRVNVLRGVGVTARLARQTHCKRGHEFVARVPGRSRVCPTCRKIRSAP